MKRHTKGLNAKCIRAMCVFEYRMSHAPLAHDTANPSQRDIKPHGFWYLGGKQPKLHFAGAAGLCMQSKPKDCRLGRMRLQIQVDELQP
jgi:hypothetical protein